MIIDILLFVFQLVGIIMLVTSLDPDTADIIDEAEFGGGVFVTIMCLAITYFYYNM